MKNNKIKIIIAAIIIVVSLVVSTIFALKEKVYDKDTYTKLLNNKYNVVDKTSDYDNNDNIKVYLESTNKKDKYKVDFYIMTSNKEASNYYKETVNNMNNEVNGIKPLSNSKKLNYNKYIMNANGNYTVIIRSKNTIIFINTKEEYKDNVDNLIKELKY